MSIIAGKIIHTNGNSATSIKVNAYFKAVTTETLAGSTTTDYNGNYSIDYTALPANNHVVVKIPDAIARKRFVKESEIIFNAGAKVRIDLTLPEGSTLGLSEFEVGKAAVASSMTEVDFMSLDNAGVTVLTVNTGLAPQILPRLQAALSVNKANTTLAPEVAYALLAKKGNEQSIDLFDLAPSDFEHLLNQATKEHLVPARTLSGTTTVDYQNLRIQQYLKRPSFGANVSMEDIWSTIKMPSEIQHDVMQLYLNTQDNPSDFWNRLPKIPTLAPWAAKIQLVSALNNLTLGNVLLIQLLLKNKALRTIENCATWTDQFWLSQVQHPEVQNSVPSEIEGKNIAEKQANYAQSMRRMMENLYPSTSLKGHLLTDLTLDAGTRKSFDTFFKQNAQFEIGRTSFNNYLNESPTALEGIQDVEQFKKEFAQLEIQFLLAPPMDRYLSVRALRSLNVNSAYQLVQKGINHLKSNTSKFGVSNERVIDIFNNAQQIVSFTQMAFLKFGNDHAIPTFAIQGSANPLAQDAVWKQFFGSEDYCACKECRSVYSPAAYLTDQLHFLEERKTKNGKSLFTILDKRRPDLKNILLNCSNAHTPMPYIDLVNEIMENALIEKSDFSFQTTRTNEELNALPENRTQAAYDTLKSKSYPWICPFDFNTEIGRIYLEHLGTTHGELTKLFQQGESEIIANTLGISQIEQITLSGYDYADNFKKYWNLSGNEPIKTLEKVTTLMAKSGLGFTVIQELLNTKCINADGHIVLDDKQTCNLDNAYLNGIKEADFKNIFLFSKLRQKLGLSIQDLDQMLFALLAKHDTWYSASRGLSEIELRNHQLRWIFGSIAELVGTLNKVKKPLSEVVTWFGKMPTRHKSNDKSRLELYEKTFLSKSTDHAEQLLFELNEGNTELKSAPDVQSTQLFVAASLNMDATDLGMLIAYFGYTKYDLTKLSQFYGIQSYCRAKNIGIADYLFIRGQIEIPKNHFAYHPKLDKEIHQLSASRFDIETLRFITGDKSDHKNVWSDEKVQETITAIAEKVETYSNTAFTGVDAPLSLEDTIHQVLSNSFDLEPTIVEALSQTVNFESIFSASDLSSKQTVIKQLNSFAIFQSALAIPNKWTLSLINSSKSPYRLQLKNYTTDEVVDLLSLISVWKQMDDEEGAWLEILTQDEKPPVFEAQMAKFLRWEEGEINILTDSVLPFTSNVAEYYQNLIDLRNFSRKVGVSFATDLDSLKGLTVRQFESKDVQFIADVAQSRYGKDKWLPIAKKLRDPIREKQRDALIASLLANNAFVSVEDLYAHYLVDVEMSACMQSSRILLAISSVQLFVQRCILNLENEVDLSGMNAEEKQEWEEWAWRKNYRVWEANRKIFLYPENWLEPEWRDDKTPIFKELEEELLQNELTNESAEKAYLNYLEKLEVVSNLEIMALCEAEDEGDYYIIGRTYHAPKKYFFRKYASNYEHFSSWKKIELDLDGDHLVPVVHNNRLRLFWITAKEEASRGTKTQTEFGSVENEGVKSTVVHLHWSDLKHGNWTAKRQSKEFIEHLYPAKVEKLRIESFFSETENITFELWYSSVLGEPSNTRPYVGRFIFNSSNDIVTAQNISIGQNYSFAEPRNFALNHQWLEHGIIDDLIFPIGNLHLSPKRNNRIKLSFITNSGDNLNGQAQEITLAPDLSNSPFVFSDNRRTILFKQIDGRSKSIELNYPFADAFQLALNNGFNSLFDINSISSSVSEKYNFQLDYEILSTYWIMNLPIVDLSFKESHAYSQYNWELFFHIPMLIANQLTQDQRFEEARKWYHYIFNPTDTSSESAPKKFWKFKPFHEYDGVANIREILDHGNESAADEAMENYMIAIQHWEENPFSPHTVARDRMVAYMKNVVMKYIDNLLAWGDQLFRLDTMESTNEATQLYMLAWNLLGKKPNELKSKGTEDRSYFELKDELDDFSNARLSTLERTIAHRIVGHRAVRNPFELLPVTQPELKINLPKLVPPSGEHMLEINSYYFCLLPNAKLLSYWDLIADRFFKLRNCRNIDGVVRALPLYQPPIDPALLIRAKQAGLDIGQVLDQTQRSNDSNYRFVFLVSKAIDYANDVRSLGGALLSALEKKDSEEFAQLRTIHEVTLLDAQTRIRKNQIRELQESRKALDYSLSMSEKRYNYYAQKERLSAKESSQLSLVEGSNTMQTIAQSLTAMSTFYNAIPDFQTGVAGLGAFFAVANGGKKQASVAEAYSSLYSLQASIMSMHAAQVGQVASYDRRFEEWQHQVDLISDELEQLNTQMLAADIRLSSAEKELENHTLQLEFSKEQREVLQTKFTNKELYSWMVGQLKTLYFQSYQMAFDMAKSAERALIDELDLQGQHYVQNIYWNNAKEGLLSGDKLFHDLKRMEMAYIEENTRRHEVSKTVSLAMISAKELARLRATGTCTITIPELLLDLDFPQHHNRKIKSVSVTIPAVSGPYASINAVLSNSNGSIATSSGQNDAGMFQFNFNDERYLPFEGMRFEPIEEEVRKVSFNLLMNDEIRTFDYNTITDVLLHIHYTAEEITTKGDLDKKKTTINTLLTGTQFTKLISLKNEFSQEWFEAKSSSADSIQFDVEKVILPYFARDKSNVETVVFATVDTDGKLATKPEASSPKEVDFTNAKKELGTSYSAENLDLSQIIDVLVVISYKI